MNIDEKLEELGIDKAQLVIFAVIGLVVVFLISGMLSNDSEKPESSDSIEMPENKAVKEYESKLDAYARENEPKENKVSLNFDRDLLEDDTNLEKTKKEALEEKIDSMLASKSFEKSTKSSKPKKRYTSSSRQAPRSYRQTTPSRVEAPKKTKEELELEALRAEEKAFYERAAKNKAALEALKEKELADTPKSVAQTDSEIYAMISGDQNLASGERLTMRLTKDAVIQGRQYARNTFVYGFVKYAKNRIYITVNNIQNNPANIGVYDAQDGGLGLYTRVNIVEDTMDNANDAGVGDINTGNGTVGKVLNSAKDLLKKKNKPQKILLFNRTKLILKKLK